jgi:hypothetical protein
MNRGTLATSAFVGTNQSLLGETVLLRLNEFENQVHAGKSFSGWQVHRS